jgi:hypothetical protein
MKTLIFSNLLARHAKRVTVKVEDIRLLRQIWKIIQPNHILAEDTKENNDQRELKKAIEKLRIAETKKRLTAKVNRLRRAGRLRELTTGERNFMRYHGDGRSLV